MKLCNFLRLDPDYSGDGLRRGSKLEEVIWAEFASDVPELKRMAESIRKNYTHLPLNQSEEELQDDEEFPEGNILTRLHRIRERRPDLTKKKKERVFKEKGKLQCEVCSFDFYETYGDLGYGYAECHHIVPLSLLMPGAKTRLSDLSIVCANCHRMLHRSRKWLSVDELRGKTKLTKAT